MSMLAADRSSSMSRNAFTGAVRVLLGRRGGESVAEVREKYSIARKIVKNVGIRIREILEAR